MKNLFRKFSLNPEIRFVIFVVFISSLFSLLDASLLFAAVSPAYKIGGQVGRGFSLTNIQLQHLNIGERWVLSVGDRFGQDNKNNPPYYHLEMKNSQLIYLDLAQTVTSQLTNEQMIDRLKNSKFFKNIDVTVDPIDQSLNLRVQLKKQASLKVYQVKGEKQTSKIVLDLFNSEKN